jgi:hypothetical protein
MQPESVQLVKEMLTLQTASAIIAEAVCSVSILLRQVASTKNFMAAVVINSHLTAVPISSDVGR